VLSAQVASPRADHVDHGMSGERLMLRGLRDSAATAGITIDGVRSGFTLIASTSRL
jgi:hypothetical protein